MTCFLCGREMKQDENGQWLCTNAKCVRSKPIEPVTDTKTDATTADGSTNEIMELDERTA